MLIYAGCGKANAFEVFNCLVTACEKGADF